MCPALTGRFSTTAPPGKPPFFFFFNGYQGIFFLIFIYLAAPGVSCGMHAGSRPSAWEHRVLTTRPPGKSLLYHFFDGDMVQEIIISLMDSLSDNYEEKNPTL